LWPQVRAHIPNAQLVLVGTGEDRERLMQLPKAHMPGDHILFTGWVNDRTLHEIYRRVALFVLPSSGEGFGLVLLEAMQHQLPCIASRTDATREVVRDGESGFLVDPADGDEICRRIVELLRDPALREKFGRAGAHLAATYFGYEAFRGRLSTALAPLYRERERR
jgi:phosphatidyl-myo-inositol dimannoside synthase